MKKGSERRSVDAVECERKRRVLSKVRERVTAPRKSLGKKTGGGKGASGRSGSGAGGEATETSLETQKTSTEGVRMLETAIMRPALNESNLIEFEFYRLKAMSATMLSEQARKIPPRPIKNVRRVGQNHGLLVVTDVIGLVPLAETVVDP